MSLTDEAEILGMFAKKTISTHSSPFAGRGNGMCGFRRCLNTDACHGCMFYITTMEKRGERDYFSDDPDYV